MRGFLIVLFISLGASTAWATDASVCRELAGPMGEAADGTRGSRSVVGFDLSQLRGAVAGGELAAIEELARAHAELVGPLEAFADKLEDVAYLMRRCAR